MFFAPLCSRNVPARSSLRPGLPVALMTIIAAVSFCAEPAQPTRPMRDLNKDYFPFAPVENARAWKIRRQQIKERILVAAGLYPMPERTPLNAVNHGRIELDDYTVDKVFFESLPGHWVTGNLYLPKNIRGKIPAIICPHGHWPDGRFMDAKTSEIQKQIDTGAEQLRNAARSPLQARCVQLARMGCAVFFYDMLGYADSVQFPEHRHGPAARGFVSPEAERQLVGYFGLQTWNSLRVVDFVASLPYVDKSRIGCTGASGGGTQTMMVSALDDRIAAAFPCVMVSTAMQGGCSCENADYLRINQGNIDIAAATAPRPLGMTAADDWTKELETKGHPDLKHLYQMLGVPDRVEAHFNIKFPHNYNAVSRAQMYAFFNRHFRLGLGDLTERDFQFLSARELTVWTAPHPKPQGDQVGEPHEISILNWFKHQAEKQLDPLITPASSSKLNQARELLGGAWEVMIGRSLPQRGEARFTNPRKAAREDHEIIHATATFGDDTVATTLLVPSKGNHQFVLWLSLKDSESLLRPDDSLSPAAQSLLREGFAIACPTLYQSGATQNRSVYDNGRRNMKTSFEGLPAFQYGYNPTLFAERVRDALTVIAALRDDATYGSRKIRVAGLQGAGVIGIAAAALAGSSVTQLACDTEGFRFSKLEDVWDANFVPGATKYGDVTGLLELCAATPTTLLGETAESVAPAVAAFKVAGGRLGFARSDSPDVAGQLAEALAGRKSSRR